MFEKKEKGEKLSAEGEWTWVKGAIKQKGGKRFPCRPAASGRAPVCVEREKKKGRLGEKRCDRTSTRQGGKKKVKQTSERSEGKKNGVIRKRQNTKERRVEREKISPQQSHRRGPLKKNGRGLHKEKKKGVKNFNEVPRSCSRKRLGKEELPRRAVASARKDKPSKAKVSIVG